MGKGDLLAQMPRSVSTMPVIKTKKTRLLIEQPGFLRNGAGEETRTLDVHLGKVVLYQLSYSRVGEAEYSTPVLPVNQIIYFRTPARRRCIYSFSPAGCAAHVNPSP